MGHLRTRNGDHEVDLVLIRDDGKVVALGVKLAATVADRDTRHLHWLARQMGTDLLDALIITPARRPTGDPTGSAWCRSGSSPRSPVRCP